MNDPGTGDSDAAAESPAAEFRREPILRAVVPFLVEQAQHPLLAPLDEGKLHEPPENDDPGYDDDDNGLDPDPDLEWFFEDLRNLAVSVSDLAHLEGLVPRLVKRRERRLRRGVSEEVLRSPSARQLALFQHLLERRPETAGAVPAAILENIWWGAIIYVRAVTFAARLTPVDLGMGASFLHSLAVFDAASAFVTGYVGADKALLDRRLRSWADAKLARNYYRWTTDAELLAYLGGEAGWQRLLPAARGLGLLTEGGDLAEVLLAAGALAGVGTDGGAALAAARTAGDDASPFHGPLAERLLIGALVAGQTGTAAGTSAFSAMTALDDAALAASLDRGERDAARQALARVWGWQEVALPVVAANFRPLPPQPLPPLPEGQSGGPSVSAGAWGLATRHPLFAFVDQAGNPANPRPAVFADGNDAVRVPIFAAALAGAAFATADDERRRIGGDAAAVTARYQNLLADPADEAIAAARQAAAAYAFAPTPAALAQRLTDPGFAMPALTWSLPVLDDPVGIVRRGSAGTALADIAAPWLADIAADGAARHAAFAALGYAALVVLGLLGLAERQRLVGTDLRNTWQESVGSSVLITRDGGLWLEAPVALQPFWLVPAAADLFVALAQGDPGDVSVIEAGEPVVAALLLGAAESFSQPEQVKEFGQFLQLAGHAGGTDRYDRYEDMFLRWHELVRSRPAPADDSAEVLIERHARRLLDRIRDRQEAALPRDAFGRPSGPARPERAFDAVLRSLPLRVPMPDLRGIAPADRGDFLAFQGETPADRLSPDLARRFGAQTMAEALDAAVAAEDFAGLPNWDQERRVHAIITTYRAAARAAWEARQPAMRDA